MRRGLVQVHLAQDMATKEAEMKNIVDALVAVDRQTKPEEGR